MVISVLFTACSSGDTPTDSTPRPTFEQRLVIEACPPVDTLAMGSHIPCESIRVEERVDDGPWEESFSYRNFRMHVRTPDGEEIRVFGAGLPNTNDTVLAEWDTRQLIVVNALGTWSVRATADGRSGNAIRAAVERFEAVE